MIRMSLAVLAILLSACSQQPPSQRAELPPATTAPPHASCSAQASHDWSAVGSQYYLIEAEAEGPTCAEAQATMRIKSRDGAVLFERTYATSAIPLAFSPNSDQTTLRSEVEAWAENAAETPTADWLPAWPARAERPPFFQPAVSRNVYENARGAQGPLFCFPDGSESNACVAMAGDRATLLGSRTHERE